MSNNDDMPIGQTNKQPSEMSEFPTDNSKSDNSGPLEDRLVSKNWQTRANAYEELQTSFKNAPNSHDFIFKDHGSSFKKYLGDVNPGSLEKALDCLGEFINRADKNTVSNSQNDIIKALIEKCIGHVKANIKQKGLDCFNQLFVASEDFENSVDTMCESLNSKNIKVQTASVTTLVSWITHFGVKKIKIKPFLPIIEGIAGNANPQLRAEGIAFYKEVYRWIGDAIKPFLEKLKKQQQDELEESFKTIEKNAKPLLLTKSDQLKAKEDALDNIIKQEEEDKKDVIDAFDLAEPKDILSKYNMEWCDKILEIKKWNEKKEMLEELYTESNVPKLKSGDYMNLAKAIKKLVNDANITVSLAAVKACGPLANGLRKEFEQCAKELLGTLLLKFKEKKPGFSESLHAVLDNFLFCSNLEEFMIDVVAGLNDKAPAVKIGTSAFVERAGKQTYIDVLQRINTELASTLVKCSEDQNGEVREAALGCLGVLKGRLGDPLMSKYIADLNPQKLAKVKEAADTIKPSKYDRPEKPVAPPPGMTKKPAAKKAAPKADAKAKPMDEPMEIDAYPSQAQEDELMSFNSKPTKPPPSKFSKKVEESKEDGGDDVEMKDEAVVTPKPRPQTSKPPMLEKQKTQAPAKKEATGLTKDPKAPEIKDEDLGQGLSKEEAENKVIDTFPADIVAKFEEAKWQDKVEGFKSLGEQIQQLMPPADVIEAVFKFTKAKMKDFKESNINLCKECVALYLLIAQTVEKINKRSVSCVMGFVSDKLGDVKFTTNAIELCLTLAQHVTPKFMANQIMKHALTAKSPKVLQESCTVLVNLTQDFAVGYMPLKEMIDFAKVQVAHQNPQVRTAAMAVFTSLYTQAGEVIRNFLKDIKEQTLKIIEDELGKVTVQKPGEHQQTRNFKGEAAQEMVPVAGKGGKKGAASATSALDEAFPREDISKQLTTKLLANFKDKDWKKRKEGCDAIETIIRGANMRIKPDGLLDLMDTMKQNLQDSNKAALKVFVNLVKVLAEALGPAIKTFNKKLLPYLLQNLQDKQTLVRADCVTTMNSYAEACGSDTIINYVAPLLTQINPELRTEALNWVIANKDGLKTCDQNAMIKPLISCIQDKTPTIRALTETVICDLMPFTGYQQFANNLMDLKPAEQSSVKALLEKCKQKAGAGNTGQDANNGSIGVKTTSTSAASGSLNNTGNANIIKKEEQKQTAPQQVQKEIITEKPKIIPSGGLAAKPVKQDLSKTLTGFTERPKTSAATQRSSSKDNMVRNTTSKLGAGSTAIGSLKSAPETVQAIITFTQGAKEKRAENDRKNKWPTEEVREDYVEKLKDQTRAILGQEVMSRMFSADFKKHLECVEMLNSFMQTQPDELKEILDIVFKWISIKMYDSQNAQFATNIFDFIWVLLQLLIDTEYQLWDFEAQVLLGMLTEKAGLNNSILKDKVKKLIKQVFQVYDNQKCYQALVQGLYSKNNKKTAECLDEIAEYLSTAGTDYVLEKDVKFFAKLADNSDKAVRENSIKVISEIYKNVGDAIWSLAGDIPPKVQGLFEQRFKKMKTGGEEQEQARPQTAVANPLKKQATLIKAPSTIISNEKKSITPRTNTLAFNKGTTPSHQIGAGETDSFSNQVIQMNERLQQQQQPAPKVIGKSGGEIGIKRAIPHTSRPGDLSKSGMDKPMIKKKDSAMDIDKGHAPHLIEKQIPTNQVTNYDDDDEDLRIFTDPNAMGAEGLQGDPTHTGEQDEIGRLILMLKHGDLSKRVDSLVSLNEMISSIEQNKNGLVRAANDLTSAFTYVLIDIFDKPIEDIPLRFAKYFITIVLKACSCKEIMRETSEDKIFDLSEQLLTRLLIENLEKVGESKEGEQILKNLNSSMLRLLENCNHTYIFCVLFNLLRKYKDFHKMPKLPGLIIKCLLKLSKILEKLIDKLDMEKILLAIHEYLVVINHDNKTQNDEMGIRIVKTVTNELVKLKKEDIWKAYAVIQCHQQPDNHIHRWIQIILKSLSTQSSSSTSQQKGSANQEQELEEILEDLRQTDKFDSAIPRLSKFLEANSSINLTEHLKNCSGAFYNYIMTSLEKYNGGAKNEELKMPNEFSQSADSEQQPQSQESSDINPNKGGQSNKISEYQNRLANIKGRFSSKAGDSTNTNKLSSASNPAQTEQPNLNTSFSAMNSSLSQRWNAINKSSLQKQNSQMSNTINAISGGGSSSQQQNQVEGVNTAGKPMNQSIGATNEGNDGGALSGQGENTGGSGGQATNQDLNKRLAEMKAKLQALKKK